MVIALTSCKSFSEKEFPSWIFKFLARNRLVAVDHCKMNSVSNFIVSAPSEVQLYSFYPHAQDKYGCSQKVKDMLKYEDGIQFST